jgi:hypothetical protein
MDLIYCYFIIIVVRLKYFIWAKARFNIVFNNPVLKAGVIDRKLFLLGFNPYKLHYSDSI